jgi:plasmid stabilization system protein ParE
MHEYIATHAGENRADDYLDRIVTFCKGLTRFPVRGTERDDLLPGLRVTGFERRITVALVVHGRRRAYRRHFLWWTGLRSDLSGQAVKFQRLASRRTYGLSKNGSDCAGQYDCERFNFGYVQPQGSDRSSGERGLRHFPLFTPVS